MIGAVPPRATSLAASLQMVYYSACSLTNGSRRVPTIVHSPVRIYPYPFVSALTAYPQEITRVNVTRASP
ncbi:hypothetical protein FIBSPDRAFT_849985 [Athelia psychrophila]|uniref:Uncharacterized protein n=1 Tax=Athelia psychrophila TaxID=1759441 RepID=A0A166HQW4_9AGAM|nr:hypothetical protein FIBSPDRAFT_863053 [Fibularhizoctonia sp. CBS 109695]KZP30954.1 hypothetical protein FIBSPDRAFT_849985 [Fibularhizoctonia sp. CBS 109695]